MAFRFSLQKIVDLKSNEKTQAEWLLSSAIGIMNQEQMTLNQLLEEKRSMQEMLQQAAEQCASVSDIQFLQSYVAHLDACIERKQSDLTAAKRHVELKQQALLHKSIDEKVWLKAREKAYQRFQVFMLRKQQQELDEIALMRHSAES